MQTPDPFACDNTCTRSVWQSIDKVNIDETVTTLLVMIDLITAVSVPYSAALRSAVGACCRSIEFEVTHSIYITALELLRSGNRRAATRSS